MDVYTDSDGMNRVAVENEGGTTLPSGTFGYAVTGLTDGTTYYFRVQDTISTPYNHDTLNDWVTATTPLAAPMEPSRGCRRLVGGRADVERRNQPGRRDSGDRHRRWICSTNGENFTPLATLGPCATGYLDTTASPGTQYWYQVKEVQGDTASQPSSSATATTVAQVWVSADADGGKDGRQPGILTIHWDGSSQSMGSTRTVYFTLGGSAIASLEPTSDYPGGIATDDSDYTVEGALPVPSQPGPWTDSYPGGRSQGAGDR